MTVIKIIILYFLIGFITSLVFIFFDLRNSEFDENYFKTDFINCITYMTLGGFFSPFVIVFLLFLCWLDDKGGFTFIYKTIYNIANIGVKKDEEE